MPWCAIDLVSRYHVYVHQLIRVTMPRPAERLTWSQNPWYLGYESIMFWSFSGCANSLGVLARASCTLITRPTESERSFIYLRCQLIRSPSCH
jgi:hypothetical protein